MADADSSDTDSFVTRHAWVRSVGRPDAVDEIADQFERPVPSTAASESEHVRWPQHSRGWRASALLTAATSDRMVPWTNRRSA